MQLSLSQTIKIECTDQKRAQLGQTLQRSLDYKKSAVNRYLETFTSFF